MLKAERGGIDEAVAILGLKKRTVESMALRGQLPGAAKLAHRWTFDLELLRTYVRDEVKRQCAENTRKHQRAASGVAIPFTVGLGSKADSSSGRFAQITTIRKPAPPAAAADHHVAGARQAKIA
jgi:hypothetical protein